MFLVGPIYDDIVNLTNYLAEFEVRQMFKIRKISIICFTR